MGIEPLHLEELIQAGESVPEFEDGSDAPSRSADGSNALTEEERVARSENARIRFECSATSSHPEGEMELASAGNPRGDCPSKELPWREEYKVLREAGWPWRIAAFIAWSASPKRDRWPKTQEELATQILGLTSDRVFTTWRQKYPQIDDTIATLQAAPLWAHRRDVIEALKESASNPDHRSNPDRKLFLELTGDYTPKQRVEVSGAVGVGEDLEGMPENELIKRAQLVKKE